jgi:hypothetical protein
MNRLSPSIRLDDIHRDSLRMFDFTFNKDILKKEAIAVSEE